MNGTWYGHAPALIATVLLAGVAVNAAGGDESAIKGTLCIARLGVVLSVDRSCKPVEGVTPSVTAADVERRFLWVREGQRACTVGTVRKNASVVDLNPTRFGSIKLAVSG